MRPRQLIEIGTKLNIKNEVSFTCIGRRIVHSLFTNQINSLSSGDNVYSRNVFSFLKCTYNASYQFLFSIIYIL